MKRFCRLLLTLSAIGCLVVLMGCSGDGGSDPDNGNGVDKIVDEADSELATVLFDLANEDDPEHPDDIDMTIPYNLYMDALGMDPNHEGANFGAGILEVVMLTQDPDIQDFFDDVDAFLNADAYFETNPGPGTFDGALRVAGPMLRFEQLCIPLATPARMTRGFMRMGAQTDPTVDELQQICLDEVLPRITTCIGRLTKVTADQDFIFIVTPKMQGDLGEDPIELDMTEVYVTLAGLNAVRAGLLHFTAYDFNLDAYTGEEMLAAVTPGSSFGSLYPATGDERMQSALEAWRNAVDHLDSAVEFFESETDYQGDDFIHTDPYDDFTEADLDSIKRYLPIARNILDSSDEIKLDWDGDSSTPDERIEFSLSAFYSDPVEDLKNLLPEYTPSLDSVYVDSDAVSEDLLLMATVTIDVAGYYMWQREAYFEDGEVVYSWDAINLEVPEWDTAWAGYYAMGMELPWADFDAYFEGYLEPGQQIIYCDVNLEYGEGTRSRYVPVITWEADTFEEWVLPDPTLGGLLPGMTNDRLKQVFGISGDDWEKRVELDLWDW